MHGELSEKVQGGKLVRVKVDYDTSIQRLQISGDFFLHPEDAIQQLEESVVGMKVSSSEQEFAAKTKEIVNANSLLLVGFSCDDLGRLIKGAVTSG